MKKAVFFILFLSINIWAQNPDWTVSQQLDPNPSSFVAQWMKSTSLNSIIVTYTGTSAVSYKVVLRNLKSSGAEIVKLTSPVFNFAGPGVKIIKFSEYFNWNSKYDNDYYLKVIRTNRFPEGDYQQVSEIYNESGSTILSSNTQDYTIIWPTQPSLLFPTDESSLTELKPLFSWTAVNLPEGVAFKYQLRIVKLETGQTVTHAINNNIPVYSDENLTTNTLRYPETGLPLENGKQYIWRVKAVDDKGNPLTQNNGNSEFWRFTYLDPHSPMTLPFSSLDLIKNLAWVDKFIGLQKIITPSSFSFNGSTTLKLKKKDGTVLEFPARLEELAFRSGFYNPFNFTSGKVVANVTPGALPVEWTGKFFTPQTIEYTPGTGLEMVGLLKFTSGTTVLSKEIRVPLGETGPSGIFELTHENGADIFSIGDSTARFRATSLFLNFTYRFARDIIRGEFRFFNGEIKFPKNYLVNQDGSLQPLTTGPVDVIRSVNLGSSDSVNVTFSTTRINLDFAYNTLTKQGRVNANFDAVFRYTMSNVVNISASLPCRIENSVFSSSLPEGQLSGSPVKFNSPFDGNYYSVTLSNYRLESLRFTNTGWSFSLKGSENFSGGPFLKSVNSNGIDKVEFSKDGIIFKALNNQQFSNSAFFSQNGLTVTFNHLKRDSVTLRKFVGFNPDYRVLLTFQLTQLPLNSTGELRNFSRQVEAKFTADRLEAVLPELSFANAELPIDGLGVFIVKKLRGSVSILPSNSDNLEFSAKIKGQIKLSSELFGLSANTPINIGDTAYTMNHQGVITDDIAFAPAGMKMGDMPLRGEGSKLRLFYNSAQNTYSPIFFGPAKLNIQALTGENAEITVSNLEYDVRNQRLLKFDGKNTATYSLKLPKNNPVFNFTVYSISVEKEGLIISSKSTFNFKAGGKMNATFDSARFSFSSPTLYRGRIIFDRGFAIKFEIPPSDLGTINQFFGNNFTIHDIAGPSNQAELMIKDSRAVPVKGIIVSTPNNVILDKNGITIDGVGTAKLKYLDIEADLPAKFMSFKMTYSPVSIVSGLIQFNNENEAPLILGLTPQVTSPKFMIFYDLLLKNIIPEKLPLKDTSVAYLQLWNGSTPLVSYRKVDDETLEFSLKPGQVVKAVFPGLKLGSEVTPELNVNFSSIRVKKSDYSLVSGRLDAEVSAEKLDMFDLTKKDNSGEGRFNLPVKIKRFQYQNSGSGSKLTFSAQLAPFEDKILSENLTLEVSDLGILTAEIPQTNFQLNDLRNYNLLKGENNGRVVLRIAGFDGSINTDLKNFSGANFMLNIGGALGITEQEQPFKAKGGISILRYTQNGFEIKGFYLSNQDSSDLDFGKFGLKIKDMRISALKYSKKKGWGINLALDAQLKIKTGVASFELPKINNILIDSSGITFPSFNFRDLQNTVPKFTFEGADIWVRNSRMPGTVVYSVITPGNMDIQKLNLEFDFTVGLSGLKNSVNTYTQSFIDAKGTADGVRLVNGKFDGAIKFLKIRGFANRITIGETQLTISNLTGAFTGGSISLTPTGLISLPGSFTGVNQPIIFLTIPSGLRLKPNGMLLGTADRINLDRSIRIWNADVSLSAVKLIFDTTGRQQTARIEGNANAMLNLSDNQQVRGNGNLGINLLTGNLDDTSKISVSTPFYVLLPSSDKPFMKINVQSAEYSKKGLSVKGNGTLQTAQNTSGPGVSFNNFLLRNTDYGYLSGSLTVNGSFPMMVKADPTTGMTWGVVESSYNPVSNTEAVVTIPTNFTVENNAVSLSGTPSVKLRVLDKSVDGVTAAFDQFNLRFTDFKVTRGILKFNKNTNRVARIDTGGFFVDGAFYTAPDTLILGSRKLAYLLLMKNTELYETKDSATGIVIKTKPGRKVRLQIPALRSDSTKAIPETEVDFRLVVNPTTHAVIGGSFQVAGDSLLDMKKAGLPLKIMKLGYAQQNSAYKIIAIGKLKIAKAVGDTIGVTLYADDKGMVVADSTLQGKFNDKYNKDAKFFRTHETGIKSTFKYDGLEFKLGGPKPSIKLSGIFTTQYFSKDRDSASTLPEGSDSLRIPLHFTANYDQGSFIYGLTPTDTLRFRQFTFLDLKKPNRPFISLSLPEAGDDFQFGFSGLIKADTSISKNLSFTVDSLKITKNGLSIPQIALTEPQKFDIFGAKVTLKDTLGKKGVALSYESSTNLLSISTSGVIVFMNRSLLFGGLKFSSNGDISIEQANLLKLSGQDTLSVIQDRFWVDSINISSAKNAKKKLVYYLKVNGKVKLPEPFPKTPSNVMMKIGTDGSVEGGAKVVLFSHGWGSERVESRPEVKLWVGKFVIPYAAVNLDFVNFSNSSIEFGSRFYLDTAKNKYIQIGDTLDPKKAVPDKFSPSIRVNTRGEFTFANSVTTKNCDTVTFKNLSLINLKPVFSSNGGRYKLTMGGKAALKFETISGSLTFQKLAVSSDGSVETPSDMITGGELSIKNIIKLEVKGFAMSDSPGEVKIPIKNAVTGLMDTNKVQVTSYVKFGGKLTLDKLGSGGMEEFLTYTQSDGGRNLIIRNADLRLKNDKVKLLLNITYKNDNTGFALIVAGKGQIKLKVDSIAVIVYGKFAQKGSDYSMGLFLAAEGLKVRLGAAVVLSGLGGGFFYNPEVADIDKVKELCGITDKASTSKIVSPGASFAVLIYCKLNLGKEGLIDFKNLLVVTNKGLSLSGDAVLLNKPEQFKGTYSLVIKFDEIFIEGSLKVTFKLGAIANGNGNIFLYIYGSDNWGITGDIKFALPPASIDGNGSFYVGNKGFFCAFAINKGFDIWVISIKGGLEAKMWYIKAKTEWGAYFKVYVEASVLGGIASVRAELQGILIGQPDFLLAGTASARIRLIFVSWEGSIWGKIKRSGVDAGFGRDSEIEEKIAKAKKLSVSLLDEVNKAQASMQAVRPEKIPFSPEQIKIATLGNFTMAMSYRNLERIDSAAWKTNYADIPLPIIRSLPQTRRGECTKKEEQYRFLFSSEVVCVEYATVQNDSKNSLIDYLNKGWLDVINVFRASHLTQLRPVVTANNARLLSKENDYNVAITKMKERLEDLKTRVTTDYEALNTSNSTSSFENPLSTAVFTAPRQRTEEVIPGDGPMFTLEEGVVGTNSTLLTAQLADADAFQALTIRNINRVRATIEGFNQNFGQAGQFERVGAQYADLIQQLNYSYASVANYWMTDLSEISNLKTRMSETGVADAFYDVTRPEWIDINKCKEIYKKLIGAIQFLADQEPDNSAETEWNGKANDDERRYLVRNGFNVLYTAINEKTIPGATLKMMQDTIKARIVQAWRSKAERQAIIDTKQREITSGIEELFVKRRGMTETYLNLLSSYIYWKKNANPEVQNSEIPLARLNQWRSEVLTNTIPPSLQITTPTLTDSVVFKHLKLAWSSPDENKVIEYALREGNGDNDWVSVGKSKSFIINLMPNPAANIKIPFVDNSARTFWVRARSTDGFVNYKKIEVNSPVGFDGALTSTPPTPTASTSAGVTLPVSKPVIKSVELGDYKPSASSNHWLALQNTLKARYPALNPELFLTYVLFNLKSIREMNDLPFKVLADDAGASIVKMYYKLYKIPSRDVFEQGSLTVDKLVWSDSVGQIFNYKIPNGLIKPSLIVSDNVDFIYILDVSAKNNQGISSTPYHLHLMYVPFVINPPVYPALLTTKTPRVSAQTIVEDNINEQPTAWGSANSNVVTDAMLIDDLPVEQSDIDTICFRVERGDQSYKSRLKYSLYRGNPLRLVQGPLTAEIGDLPFSGGSDSARILRFAVSKDDLPKNYTLSAQWVGTDDSYLYSDKSITDRWFYYKRYADIEKPINMGIFQGIPAGYTGAILPGNINLILEENNEKLESIKYIIYPEGDTPPPYYYPETDIRRGVVRIQTGFLQYSENWHSGKPFVLDVIPVFRGGKYGVPRRFIFRDQQFLR